MRNNTFQNSTCNPEHLLSLLHGVRSMGGDRWVAKCPGHDDRSPSLSLALENGRLFLYCHAGCRFENILAAVGMTWRDLRSDRPNAFKPLPRPVAARKPRTLLPHDVAKMRRVIDQARPLEGVALDYLANRNCRIPPADSDLRFLPSHTSPCGYRGPALLAIVRNVESGEIQSYATTWICADGRKAPIETPKRFAGGLPIDGGAAMLYPNECVTHGLAVAEGVETGLCLAHIVRPVWALLSAGNLKKFGPLPGIRSLTIAADGDPRGREAAAHCAALWAGHASVRIVYAGAGLDVADVAKGLANV